MDEIGGAGGLSNIPEDDMKQFIQLQLFSMPSPSAWSDLKVRDSDPCIDFGETDSLLLKTHFSSIDSLEKRTSTSISSTSITSTKNVSALGSTNVQSSINRYSSEFPSHDAVSSATSGTLHGQWLERSQINSMPSGMTMMAPTLAMISRTNATDDTAPTSKPQTTTILTPPFSSRQSTLPTMSLSAALSMLSTSSAPSTTQSCLNEVNSAAKLNALAVSTSAPNLSNTKDVSGSAQRRLSSRKSLFTSVATDTTARDSKAQITQALSQNDISSQVNRFGYLRPASYIPPVDAITTSIAVRMDTKAPVNTTTNNPSKEIMKDLVKEAVKTPMRSPLCPSHTTPSPYLSTLVSKSKSASVAMSPSKRNANLSCLRERKSQVVQPLSKRLSTNPDNNVLSIGTERIIPGKSLVDSTSKCSRPQIVSTTVSNTKTSSASSRTTIANEEIITKARKETAVSVISVRKRNSFEAKKSNVVSNVRRTEAHDEIPHHVSKWKLAQEAVGAKGETRDSERESRHHLATNSSRLSTFSTKKHPIGSNTITSTNTMSSSNNGISTVFEEKVKAVNQTFSHPSLTQFSRGKGGSDSGGTRSSLQATSTSSTKKAVLRSSTLARQIEKRSSGEKREQEKEMINVKNLNKPVLLASLQKTHEVSKSGAEKTQLAPLNLGRQELLNEMDRLERKHEVDIQRRTKRENISKHNTINVSKHLDLDINSALSYSSALFPSTLFMENNCDEVKIRDKGENEGAVRILNEPVAFDDTHEGNGVYMHDYSHNLELYDDGQDTSLSSLGLAFLDDLVLEHEKTLTDGDIAVEMNTNSDSKVQSITQSSNFPSTITVDNEQYFAANASTNDFTPLQPSLRPSLKSSLSQHSHQPHFELDQQQQQSGYVSAYNSMNTKDSHYDVFTSTSLTPSSRSISRHNTLTSHQHTAFSSTANISTDINKTSMYGQNQISSGSPLVSMLGMNTVHLGVASPYGEKMMTNGVISLPAACYEYDSGKCSRNYGNRHEQEHIHTNNSETHLQSQIRGQIQTPNNNHVEMTLSALPASSSSHLLPNNSTITRSNQNHGIKSYNPSCRFPLPPPSTTAISPYCRVSHDGISAHNPYSTLNSSGIVNGNYYVNQGSTNAVNLGETSRGTTRSCSVPANPYFQPPSSISSPLTQRDVGVNLGSKIPETTPLIPRDRVQEQVRERERNKLKDHTHGLTGIGIPPTTHRLPAVAMGERSNPGTIPALRQAKLAQAKAQALLTARQHTTIVTTSTLSSNSAFSSSSSTTQSSSTVPFAHTAALYATKPTTSSRITSVSTSDHLEAENQDAQVCKKGAAGGEVITLSISTSIDTSEIRTRSQSRGTVRGGMCTRHLSSSVSRVRSKSRLGLGSKIMASSSPSAHVAMRNKWGEIEMLLCGTVSSQNQLTMMENDAQQASFAVEIIYAIAKATGLPRGRVSRVILPFNTSTAVSDQAASALALAQEEMAKDEEISRLLQGFFVTESALLEEMEQQASSSLSPPHPIRSVNDLVQAAVLLRSLVRVKIADENDLAIAHEGVQSIVEFGQKLDSVLRGELKVPYPAYGYTLDDTVSDLPTPESDDTKFDYIQKHLNSQE